MQRSIFTRRQWLIGAGVSALIAAGDAFCVEPKWLQVSDYDIPIPHLPQTLDGYRIAQITDAHLRHIGEVEEHLIREIENRNVELVLLTGDILDDSSKLNIFEEFCRSLHGERRVILATLGNWEHWSRISIPALLHKYQSHRIRLLINETARIGPEISVTATDDATAGRANIGKALRGRSTAAVSLFLTHSPGLLDRVPETAAPFDLALAGHTHGGQCRIGSFVPIRPPGSGRFVSGWYEVPTGRAYVSRGTGMTAIPARFCCRPELPIFTLRRA